MKKNIPFLAMALTLGANAFCQTQVSNNTDLTIVSNNSVTCNGGTNTVENRFFHIFDLENYPNITDTAFFVRMQVGVEATSGGAFNVVGKMHQINGSASLANMTLIISDTAAATPDAVSYIMYIPFDSGYALPGDSLVGEYNLPINAAVTFFPGSNTTVASSPTYIVADGCGIMDLSTMASVGFANMNLIMNVYINQKPMISGYSTNVLNNAQIDFFATDFTTNFTDTDNDGLTMIRVSTIPANGILDLNGTPLVVGDTILNSELDQMAYIPNAGYAGLDSFSVAARDSSHWSNTPAVITISVIDYQAGVNQIELPHVKIYPNPASDKITLDVPYQITEIRIFDAEGKLIMTRISDAKEVEIASLSTGNYLIEVYTTGGKFANRFVVK